MQFSIATLVLAFAAVSSAAVMPISARQNQNRPVPAGQCCVANTSLKQDTCRAANGASGRCVPGGNNCGSTLSCVADQNLACDNSIIERGKSLCRAKAFNGFIDGANVIFDLKKAKVN